MEGPRSARLGERDEVIDFVNDAFLVGGGGGGGRRSMEREFPLLLGEGNVENVVLMKEDGRVVSCAAFLVRELATGAGVLRLGAVGPAATRREFRRRGFARAILGRCHEMMRRRGVDVAIRQADRPDIYLSLGYERVGMMKEFTVTSDLLPQPGAGCEIEEIKDLSEGEIEILRDLHGQDFLGTLRSEEDSALLYGQRSVTALVARREGRAVASAVLNETPALEGELAEYAGEGEACAQLAAHAIARTGEESLRICAPAKGTRLAAALSSMGIHARIKPGCALAKIIDTRDLFKRLAPHLKSVSPGHWVVDADDSGFIVETPAGEVRIADEKVLAKLIFGADSPSVLLPEEPEMACFLGEFFPVDFFIWPLDRV